MQKLVVIGNGMAGFACLEQIRQRDHNFEITIFGDERRANYDRKVLPSVLAGVKSPGDIALNDLNWYQDNGILTRLGVRVTRLDRQRRLVVDEDGGSTAYDRLILATGARPWLPPLPGLERENVYTLRTLDDALSILQLLRGGMRAAVIGGGVLGVETACALQAHDCDVTLVQLADRLMERQLPAVASRYLQRRMESRGIRVLLGTETQSLIGGGRVEGLRFVSGEVLPADVVIIAAGIRPEVELALHAGLEVGRGVVVNDNMETSAQDVSAAGGCTEHRGRTFGLGDAIQEQARALAAAITGDRGPAFTGVVPVTRLRLPGIEIVSAGGVDDAGIETLEYEDQAETYKKLFLRDNRLLGFVLAGDISDEPRYLDWLRHGTDLGALRRQLLSPRSLEETALT